LTNFPVTVGRLPQAAANGEPEREDVCERPKTTSLEVSDNHDSATLLRSGATVALIANAAIGVLFPDHNSLPAPVQPLYVPLNLASVIAVTLLLFGLHGWYNRHAAALGRRGAVGTVLIVLTLLLVGVFIGLYLPIVMPLAAQEAPVFIAPGPALLVPVLLFGVLAEIAGPLLLGWDLLRRSIGSRWAA
jgi:hypothetical protein